MLIAMLLVAVRLAWMGCGCRGSNAQKATQPPPDAPQPPDPPAK